MPVTVTLPSTTDNPAFITVDEMAGQLGKPAWKVARGVARMIASGLLEVEGGSKEDAIASLRDQYGEAVNVR